jgi:hypothetical protein
MLDAAYLDRRLGERLTFPTFLASIGEPLEGDRLPDGEWTWVTLGGYVERAHGAIAPPADQVGFHVMEFVTELGDAENVDRLIDLAGQQIDRAVLLRLSALIAAGSGYLVENMDVMYSIGARETKVWEEPMNFESSVLHWMCRTPVRLAIGMPAGVPA